MVVTRGAQRTLLFLAFGLITVVYVFAWLAPAIGLYRDDGVYLVTARSMVAGHGYAIDSLPNPVAQTRYPPLFPALLALFSIVSMNPQWLKALPLLCALGWFVVTWKLLRKLGATANSASFLVAMTAASPTVIFLSSNLLSEPLFALLLTASMLLLVDGDHPGIGGLLAGLAIVTRIAGLPLIAAGVVALLVQRRLSGAARFAIAAMVLAMPWFAWAATHESLGSYYGLAHYSGLDVLSYGLLPAEKFRVVAFNFLFLLSAPYTLVTGLTNMVATIVSAGTILWSIIVRRQSVPDLFVGFYCLLLLTVAEPPQRLLAPILPLLLWIVWRWIATSWSTEGVAVVMTLTLSMQIFADFRRLPATRRSGVFAATGQAIDEWPQMMVLCGYLRTATPPSSVVLANLDPLFFLKSGRHAVRGFSPNGYDLFYAPVRRPVQAFQLRRSIRESHVDYVAASPDRDFAEAAGFLTAVQALERDGVVEPVLVPGLTTGYKLWRVIGPKL